jgi:hypothetical protein
MRWFPFFLVICPAVSGKDTENADGLYPSEDSGTSITAVPVTMKITAAEALQQ